MKILHNNVNLRSNCKPTILSVILLAFSILPLRSNAEMVTVDVPLTMAITTQTSTLNKTYKDRNKMRQAILDAQAGISGALIAIHAVEDEALKYMRDASSVFTNLLQIKNILESSGTLAVNAWSLIEDIPQNLKGTAVTAICYKKVEQTVTDCTDMATVLSDLVTNTTYGGKKDGNNGGKKHVNLLNSAERYHILVDVQSRLDALNMDIRLLRYYLKTLDWRDIWRTLDYESYINGLTAKRHMKSIIADWNRLKK